MSEDNYRPGISFRCNKKIIKMINELKSKMCLNTTSIMIMAIVMLYEREIGQVNTDNGDNNEQ